MRILTRYFLRAHVGPFLFALSALTLVMLLDQLSKRFGDLVGKGLDWTVVVEVFALSIPFILAMTLPMAVLAAVLYTFNRLAADNEIAALKANGVHLPSLMLPVLAVATLLAGGMVWFNNAVLPESNHRLQVLLSSISQKKPTFVLREQTVNEVLSGEMYIQVARIRRATNRLEDVVIYDERDRQVSRTIYADRGRMAYSDDRTDLYLTLFDGVNQQEKLSEPQAYERMRFQKLVMRVPDVTNRLQRRDLGGYRGDREMPIGQMRERVREARLSARAVEEESRQLAAYLTRRLLGRMPEEPGAAPEARSDTAGGGASAAGSGGQDGGRNRHTADRAAGGGADTGAGRDGRRSSDDGQGRGPDSLADAATVDSVLREARAAAHRSAVRLSSPRTVRSEFGTLETRREAALGRAARFGVEIHKKFSIPAACIVFVLIGAPLAVRYREGGVALVVAASLLFFCAYYVSLVGGEELADELILSPFWAMWAPNVLFGGVGLALVWRAVKVG